MALRSRFRTLLWTLLVVLAIVSAGLFWSNRTLILLLAGDAYRAPASISLSWRFSSYWYWHARLLRLNPRTGVWDFEWIFQGKGAKDFDQMEMGRLAWHRGDFASAVSLIESHLSRNGESEEDLFWLAMSYLRLGEADNCLAMLLDQHSGHPADSLSDHTQMCSLPLSAHHRQQEPSRSAARLFEKLLDEYDSENTLYRWLLNFCYMTVGGFPDQVPDRYRIQSRFIDAFYGAGKEEMERKYAQLHFQERAKELNVDAHNCGKGVAVEDFDRDGYLDIITGGHYSGLVYYRNQGGQGFIDRTAQAGLEGIAGIHIISAADYDNDGWMDLFVSRPNDGARGRFHLFRNQGAGVFSDVTAASGLLGEDPPQHRIMAWTSAWADVDNDGDLDLFLAKFAALNPFRDGPLLPSKLYLNQEGRFEDASQQFGLDEILKGRSIFGAAFGDYDQDGFPDLAITPWTRGQHVLFRNVQGRRFELTELVQLDDAGFGTAFLDANQDGRLDLFIAAFTGLAEAITNQVVFGQGAESYRMGHSNIWLQSPDGRFEKDNGFFRQQMPVGTMGTSYGDINNDGAYDFYLGTGNPEGWYIMPNLMYLGETSQGKPLESLTNISMLHGLGNIQKGHAIIFFDFDQDGDQDIYSSLGGMWPGDAWPNQLFVNQSAQGGSWLQIRLRGRRSNWYGVGARIRVEAQDGQGRQIVRYYHMDNKTGFGSAPYLAHIGLGEAVSVRSVEVTWPGDRSPKTYAAELGRLVVLDEDEGK